MRNYLASGARAIFFKLAGFLPTCGARAVSYPRVMGSLFFVCGCFSLIESLCVAPHCIDAFLLLHLVRIHAVMHLMHLSVSLSHPLIWLIHLGSPTRAPESPWPPVFSWVSSALYRRMTWLLKTVQSVPRCTVLALRLLNQMAVHGP